ncbi:leukocyte elastase inhibitor [Stomoxys calcitrans]|uniref:leukocyte elastase inhibitor n=1 Tax=Stomoxys calcitrans TaxID=35570 RepID=UPI0027E246F2|nr:leukocyte elastase inhibitor [Stomoxys calcitrans]
MAQKEFKLAPGCVELTLKLFDKLQASKSKENILISPLFIQTSMALTFAGAKGKTADEIASAMKFVSNCPKEVGDSFCSVLEKFQNSPWIKIANKVYVSEGNVIKPEYAAVIEDHYHAAAETIDFAKSEDAAKHINAWIESKTAGEITDIVSAKSLSCDTRLALINALYFKGEWRQKFRQEYTSDHNFWLNEEVSVKVKFMYVESTFRYDFIKELDCECLELPYKDSDLSMLVLLPAKREGLKNLAKKLKNVNLLDLDKQLKEVFDKVVRFPKFKIEYSIELSNVLKEVRIIWNIFFIIYIRGQPNMKKVTANSTKSAEKNCMGISTAFGKRAEFSNMLEAGERFNISKVFQKSSIEVNEVGDIYPVPSALLAFRTSREFDANHPFLYFVWNKKNILFAGAFVNPTNV